MNPPQAMLSIGIIADRELVVMPSTVAATASCRLSGGMRLAHSTPSGMHDTSWRGESERAEPIRVRASEALSGFAFDDLQESEEIPPLEKSSA